ncbi:MAG: UTP--glucose-1-phosphate uridylyltransferase GalU [Bacteroidales bacterium]|nr:UTP--glucose-1-phosphate uridylyltransferase GalU [Bacteroidales bacterium]
MMKVKKAVIPAAGFGTRFLPATKAQPKEMLPIVDTPTIQYVVEEAVKSGITDILMIIGRGKRSIEEYFDRNFELEMQLKEKNKNEDLSKVKSLTELANIHFVWQPEQNGLGDAIRYARYHVNNEPFAVLLGDTLLESATDVPITRQLMDVYEKFNAPVVALEEVPMTSVSRYGVMKGSAMDGGIYKINDLVEKPSMENAPSNLVIASRYILTPEIFEYLDKVTPGVNNEIQLTDAMRMILANKVMYGLKFLGKRHDIGNKLDYLKTNVIYGLRREDIGPGLRDWLKQLAKDL